MNRRNVEKPLEDVRKWKREFSKKLTRMTRQEIISSFGGKTNKENKKRLVTSKPH